MSERIAGKTVAEWRAYFDERGGNSFITIGRDLVTVLLDAIEARDKRIAELEAELGGEMP